MVASLSHPGASYTTTFPSAKTRALHASITLMVVNPIIAVTTTAGDGTMYALQAIGGFAHSIATTKSCLNKLTNKYKNSLNKLESISKPTPLDPTHGVSYLQLITD